MVKSYFRHADQKSNHETLHSSDSRLNLGLLLMPVDHEQRQHYGTSANLGGLESPYKTRGAEIWTWPEWSR